MELTIIHSPLPSRDENVPARKTAEVVHHVSSHSAPHGVAAPYEVILEPGRAERQYFRDLLHHRDLFYILAWRDISVRYKQTAIGVAWALIQPLLTVLIMTLVFATVARLPAEGNAPYPIMVLAALLPWQFFSTSLAAASQSLVNNAMLVQKVYFPRMIIPASAVMSSVVDFLISLTILAGMSIWFQFWPDWRVLVLPLFMALALLSVIGPALLITALNVKYRDFRYVVPFLLQIGLYVSPIGYSSSVIRERFGDVAFALYSLNPMVGVIDGFRWSLLRGQTTIYWPGFILSYLFVLIFLVVGSCYFRRTEQLFADII